MIQDLGHSKYHHLGCEGDDKATTVNHLMKFLKGIEVGLYVEGESGAKIFASGDAEFRDGYFDNLYIKVNGEYQRIEVGGGGSLFVHIDPVTKHWIINDVDTGVRAEGRDGLPGPPGADGKDGKDGEDGLPGPPGEPGHGDGQSSFISFVFTRSQTPPNTPIGGTFATPVPGGWSDGIPSGQYQVWITSRRFTSDGLAPQESVWKQPRPFSDSADLDIEVSAIVSNPGNPTTHPGNWYDPSLLTGNERWMAFRIAKNDVWGEWIVFPIVGEGGPPGSEGSHTETRFALNGSFSTPPIISITERYPNGWTLNTPTSVVGQYIWLSTAVIDADNNLEQNWTYPVRLTGEKGDKGDKGEPGEGGGQTGLSGLTISVINGTHVFAGNSVHAFPATTQMGIQVIQDTTAQVVEIQEITNHPAGMTTQIVDNNTDAPSIEITVTTDLTDDAGVLYIPLLVDGATYVTTFSWSVSRTGGLIWLDKSSDVFHIDKEGVITPATITVTAQSSNTVIDKYEYRVEGGPLSLTPPTGVTRVDNVITIQGNQMSASSYTFKVSDASGISDSGSVHRNSDGSDGEAGKDGDDGVDGIPGNDSISIQQSNENHTFAGTATHALAGSVISMIKAYNGNVAVAATIGEVEGMPSGMTVTLQNNGTVNAQFTVTVTNSLVQRSGMLVLPVTIEGITFTKTFSWDVSAGANIILDTAVSFLTMEDNSTTPATHTITAIARDTTINRWRYSVDGTSMSVNLPAGFSRTGNTVTITGASMSAKHVRIEAASTTDDIIDTTTVLKLPKAGAGSKGDTIVISQSNESHLFAGTADNALAGSTITKFTAYENGAAIPVTIGTITGQVTGLTASIQSNGTVDAQVTVTVTTSLVARDGVLTIPITVDGAVYPKTFSWAVSRSSVGEDAKLINLETSALVVFQPASGGATDPATVTVTGTAQGTTINSWQYAINNGSFSNTLPTGVTRSGNTVTIVGANINNNTRVRMASTVDNISDTVTIKKVVLPNNGDTIIISQTNENHTFPGTETSAIAGSTTSEFEVFKNGVNIPCTIGTITGQVTGLTTSLNNNGTVDAGFTVTVTTALVAQGGTLQIPLTVDGLPYTKTFSWSVSRGGKGESAKLIHLQSSSQWVTQPSSGGATTPSTVTVTGTAQNTTINSWQYSVNGGSFSTTTPTGVTRSGNVVTIVGANITTSIGVRMASTADNVSDVTTVYKIVLPKDGEDGYSQATVYLYRRTETSEVPPAKPSNVITYTFSTGNTTAANNGWTRSLPSSGGRFRWVIQAQAISRLASDTIAASEWSNPVIISEDGVPGTAGPAMAYRGQWSNLVQYNGSLNLVEFVTTGQAGSRQGWITRSDAGAIPKGTAVSNSTYWNGPIANADAIFTDFIMAYSAYIDNLTVGVIQTSTEDERTTIGFTPTDLSDPTKDYSRHSPRGYYPSGRVGWTISYIPSSLPIVVGSSTVSDAFALVFYKDAANSPIHAVFSTNLNDIIFSGTQTSYLARKVMFTGVTGSSFLIAQATTWINAHTWYYMTAGSTAEIIHKNIYLVGDSTIYRKTQEGQPTVYVGGTTASASFVNDGWYVMNIYETATTGQNNVKVRIIEVSRIVNGAITQNVSYSLSIYSERSTTANLEYVIGGSSNYQPNYPFTGTVVSRTASFIGGIPSDGWHMYRYVGPIDTPI